MAEANAGVVVGLESRIKAIVARHLGVPVEELDVSSRLVEDLGADSLDVAEIELSKTSSGSRSREAAPGASRPSATRSRTSMRTEARRCERGRLDRVLRRQRGVW